MQLTAEAGYVGTDRLSAQRVAMATMIGDAIRDLAQMRRHLERELVCETSAASLSVLSALERRGSMRVSELAEILDVDLSVASRYVSTYIRVVDDPTRARLPHSTVAAQRS